MRKADDALMIDSSTASAEEVAAQVLLKIREKREVN